MRVHRLWCLGWCLAASAAMAADPSTDSVPEGIKLPPGFHISVYAHARGARSMTLSPSGILYVGTREEGKVYAIPDRSHRGKADEVVTIASGLDMPNGVAFRDGSLYVAEVSRIIRFDNIESALAHPPRPVVVTSDLPHERAHGWKFLRFGPDGQLCFPIGAPCNACEPPDPRYATIMRMDRDGRNLEVFARGVRNSVGFDWDPDTKDLWFTDNGRDWLGDNLPPDELNHAPRQGLNFGFPYFFGKNVPDPEFGKGRNPQGFVPAALDLPAHVASLGMRFYTGRMFPEKYWKQIFVAEHGSWNRTEPIGYRVTLVTMAQHRPVGYHVFAEGWLRSDGTVTGRPVDVQVMPDGAMLVSDDYAGLIYRIAYDE